MGNKWAEKRFTMPYFREALWQKGYVVDTLETATDWHNVDNLLTKIETNLRTVLAQDLNAEEVPQLHVFTHLSHFYQQGSSIYTTYIFKVLNTISCCLSFCISAIKATYDIICRCC